MDPVMLIEQANNRGTLYAVVEQDDRVAYFYLYPSELFTNKYSPRPCWLRNLKAAPHKKDVQAMREGMAPMLEAAWCSHPEGKEPLEADRIEIVWTEEGDGAALLYDGALLGVIPGWTLYSDERAVAYATDCTGADDNSIVFPLGTPATNTLHAKVEKAAAFWKEWSDETNQAWGMLQPQYLHAYEAVLGETTKYYAIDGDQWPPMGLARFENNETVYLITLGMSIRPMPVIEIFYNDNAPAFRRAELAMAFPKKDFPEEQIMEVAATISGLADRPWKTLSWFGAGHTVGVSALPEPYNSLLLSAPAATDPAIAMPVVYGDPVNLYWLTPVQR
ncbi:suppressor of fused domain protein [Chitinophaga sp. Mgbs1]|uniref:Suppressor of fused domain protein n=1 Tax=Chitinophaga solisilvae TaxID=1233460 RepID=A0A433WLD1_9BACT|nr:suppressor of fused domain protein [Chitinophaga solisilvae]